MDYCSSCRRHLNGALVCPGCGAYAPDIAPHTAAPSARATSGTAAWQAPADTAWFDTDAYAEEDVESPYDGPDAAPPASVGRAARRRQRVRWKKNQRRAVVATTVALIGGGLTVASMNRQGADRAQAATAPDNRPMGLADEQATDAQVSTPTGRHRAPDTTATTRSATANTPHEQTTGAPRATPTPGQDTAAAPHPATTSAARAQSAATASGTTDGTAAGTTAAAATPAATASTSTSASTGSGTSTGAGTPTSSASPSPAATSPSELCLLVICIG
jgi:hypothetical protein